MRLIDVDELKKPVGSYNPVKFTHEYGYVIRLEDIDHAPTVEAVKHGRWIEENRRPKSSQFYCSECHRTAYDIQPNRKKGWVKRCRYAYCPNCGAYMKGEQDEAD